MSLLFYTRASHHTNMLLFLCQLHDQLKRKLEETEARAKEDALENVTVSSHVIQLVPD